MARFRFRLQRVLDVKHIREKQRVRELAEAAREREHERLAEAALRDEQGRLREARRQSADAGALQIESQLAGGMRRKIRQQTARTAAAQRAVETAQHQLLNAMKERKALDKLSERRQEEFRVEQSRLERRFIDEIAGQAAYRQKAERRE